MWTIRITRVLVLALALMIPGCACLRPPAYDRQAWEAQEKQESVRQESAMESDPLGMALYFAYVGYCLGEIGWALAHK
jgi:hypothetical protein